LVGELEERLLFRVDAATKNRLVAAFGEKLVLTELIELGESFGRVGIPTLLADLFGDCCPGLRHYSCLSLILIQPIAVRLCRAQNPQAEAYATLFELSVDPKSSAW